MATDQRSLSAFFNTDADFQAWVQGLQAQFAACGLVRTSDTGQINSATVLKPAAVSTAQGYEVYALNDSSQAALPVVFKIEYGSGPTAADRPGLWLTLGVASGGNGAISGGNSVTRVQIASGASKSAGAVLPSYCSGDGSRIALIVNYDQGSNTFGFGFVIDRLRDVRGQSAGEGSVCWTSSAVSTATMGVQVALARFVLARLTAATNSFQSPVPGAHSTSSGILGGGSSLWGSRIGTVPLMALMGELRFGLAAAFYNPSDGAPGVVSVTTLGQVHSFMCLPSVAAVDASLLDALMILWE